MSADSPKKDKDPGHHAPRETGSSGKQNSVDTSSVPNPQAKNRPMTDDEKVDEAAIESMDASDPPAFQPSTTGAADDRKSGNDKSKTKP